MVEHGGTQNTPITYKHIQQGEHVHVITHTQNRQTYRPTKRRHQHITVGKQNLQTPTESQTRKRERTNATRTNIQTYKTQTR